MSVEGVISEEYDHFLLMAQQKKAVRLVLTPLSEDVLRVGTPVDHEQLDRALRRYIGEFRELPSQEQWFEGFEGAVSGLCLRLPGDTRSAIDEFKQPQEATLSWDPRFSERAFLGFTIAKFIEKALQRRAMICVAQNGAHYSVVSRSDFGSEDDDELPLPAKRDPFPVERFTEHWCEELGADRLWFAVTNDVEPTLSAFTGSNLCGDGERVGAVRQRRSPRSLEEQDAPFVARALKAIEEGDAQNANQAIDLLVHEHWKEVAPDATSFANAVAGGGTLKAKSDRIYRRLRETIKNSRGSL